MGRCPVNRLASVSLSTILLLGAACDKGPSAPSAGNGAPACGARVTAGAMTATIDGVASSGTNVTGQLTCLAGTSPYVLTLSTNLAGSELRISIAESSGIRPGTFPVVCVDGEGATAYLLASPFAAWSAGCLWGSGSITLSSWTAGTFEFGLAPAAAAGAATGLRSVTSGSFDVTF